MRKTSRISLTESTKNKSNGFKGEEPREVFYHYEDGIKEFELFKRRQRRVA